MFTESVLAISSWILAGERTSTCTATASPPASTISRVTVVMVDDGELGSGGKGVAGPDESLIVLAATTTAWM